MSHPKKPVPNHQINPHENVLDKSGRAKQSNQNNPEKNNISDKESIGRPKSNPNK